MKRRVLLILTLMLLLLSFQPVRGEEPIPGKQTFYVYFPTQSVSEFRTVQYLINARSARWTQDSPYYANINLQKLYDQGHMTDAIKTGKSWDGNLSPRVKSIVLDVISSQAAGVNLCLLIPSDLVKTVFQQGDFFSWLLDILQGGKSKVHFYIIGEKTDLSEETKEVFREYSDSYDVTLLVSDFLQETVKETEGNVHTGDYYIASLYGTPMDLPLTKEEGQFAFHLPEEGQVFFLTREAGDLQVESEQGAIVPYDETKAISVPGPEKKDPVFRGRMTVSIPAGKYTIRMDGITQDDSGLKAYWYPDLENLTIKTELPENFQHGDNSIHFTLSNEYGRPEEIRVEYRTGFNGEEPGLAIPVEYTEEEGWTALIHADADQDQIQLVPAARLNAGDGNLIFSVSGESIEREIRNQETELRADLPDELTLYLDQAKEQRGTLSFRWADFFVYNAADEPHQFEVKVDQPGEEGAAEKEVSVEVRQEEGFTVTANQENGDAPVTMTVSCDETLEKTFSVFCRDIGSLVAEMIRVESEQQDQLLKPGQEMILKVTMDENLAETMEKAAAQGLEVPDVSSLTVWASLDDEKKTSELANAEGTELSFPIKNVAGGEKALTYQIVSEKSSAPAEKAEEEIADGEKQAEEQSAETGGDEKPDQANLFSAEVPSEQQTEAEKSEEPEREWKAGSISFELKNGPPEATEGIQKEVVLPLHGLFGQYEPVELFQSVFGTDDPRKLFYDVETDIESVTLEIEGLEGIETDEENRELTKTGKAELVSPISIRITAPYSHTLTLTAYDGVNYSEPLVVQVKVYSLFIHYLIGAGLVVALLLIILAIILIVRQARKPSFQNIRIRCLTIMDEDQERCRELLGKGNAVPLVNFGKKPVPMSVALILAGQSPLTEESMRIVRDISLLPTRYDEVIMVFGKDAMKQLGRREKKEQIAQGNAFRIRLDGSWLYVENVR